MVLRGECSGSKALCYFGQFVAVQWDVCDEWLCDTFEQIEKNDGELRQYRDIVVADDA